MYVRVCMCVCVRACACAQERTDDDVIETQLFLRQVTSDSFRLYTLVAENAIAVRTHDVRFVRSKQCTLHARRARHCQCQACLYAGGTGTYSPLGGGHAAPAFR